MIHISTLYTLIFLRQSGVSGFLWTVAWPSENKNIFDAHKPGEDCKAIFSIQSIIKK